MGDKLLKWDSFHNSLSEKIYCYFINQKMVDVTLKCRDGEIKAHSIILCAGSSFFENIIQVNEFEHRKCIIFLERNISRSTMQYLLEFLYVGQVVVPNTELKSVLNAAALYEVRGIVMSENDLVSSTQIMESSTNKLSPSKAIDVLMIEEPSSSSSPVITHRNPSAVTTSLRKNPLALIRNVSVNSREDNSRIRKKKNVPGCDDSEETDSTQINDPKEGGSSVDVNNFDKRPVSDEEVEVIIHKNDTIVIPDSQNSTMLSPDLCERAPSKSVQNRFEPFLSTDDESDEPIAKRHKKQSSSVKKNTWRNVSTEKRNHSRKIKKYEELLIKSAFIEVDQFCVVCFKFHKDPHHIPNAHKTLPRNKLSCVKCRKQFYFASFLDLHLCNGISQSCDNKSTAS